MKEATIRQAKKYIFSLIGYKKSTPLCVLTQDSCSEISRLLGLWLYKKYPKARIYIYKGRVRARFHDLLLVEENKVYVIDPTVWQFSKNKKSILIAEEDSLKDALTALSQYYGGKWKLSESVRSYSQAEIKKLKDTIKKNIT
ncbi:MAG: hypothetical protein ABR884_04380 [Minisyncoccia bacterium]|jgi:hypothetical protein